VTRLRPAGDVVTHMKTTVEMSDAIMEEAKRLVSAEGITLKALLEEALRRMIAEREARGAFQLRKASFGGVGLRPEVREGG
jgi:hypothetical protein